MLDLDAIKERCEVLDERMGEGPWTLEGSIPYVGLFSVYDSDGNVISHGVKEEQFFIAHSRVDIPALVAEVERLRASLEEILDEVTSDFDQDIIITECQSALAYNK